MYLHFSGQEVVEAHVLEECDPLSAEISINTLKLSLYNADGRFSILNPEGYFDVLQHKQPLTVWEDVKQDARSTSSVSHGVVSSCPCHTSTPFACALEFHGERSRWK